MRLYRLNSDKPHYRALREVVDILAEGGVIVYPTDTLYGLGCGMNFKESIERIGRLKGRADKKPFSFICADISSIGRFCHISNQAHRLMSKCLPGPYTFVLEARPNTLPKRVVGKRNSVGVRIPNHRIALDLVEALGFPIISTSANLSGEATPESIADMPKSLTDNLDAAIDVGPLRGDPSTVIDLTGEEPVVLREGAGALPWKS